MPYPHSKSRGNTEQDSGDQLLTVCPPALQGHRHCVPLGSEGHVGGGGWRAWNDDQDEKNPGWPPWACGLRSSEFPSPGDTTGKFIVISQSLCLALHTGLIRINPKPVCPVCPFLCSQRRLDSCGEWLQTHCGMRDFHCPKTHERRDTGTMQIKQDKLR